MKLLVCSNGSAQAERAVRLCRAVVSCCPSEVTLLGIIEAPGDSKPLLESLQRGQALLGDKGIPAELITKAGLPIPEIIKCTRETHYDLVVIGTVRKATEGRFWMPSKAYRIIKEITPPVLLVSGGASLEKALLCTGGRHYIDPAVRLTGELARCAGARVTLLHVVPRPPAIYATLPRMKESAARLLESSSELGRNLRRQKETLDSLKVAAQVRLRRGSVVDEILREIDEGGYDLVVTGSSLSRGLRTYVLGDVSREIVNRANCSVLVARSQPPPGEPSSGLRAWLGGLGRRSPGRLSLLS
jgi:nucleotide-binding universal stress UspA family protein